MTSDCGGCNAGQRQAGLGQAGLGQAGLGQAGLGQAGLAQAAGAGCADGSVSGAASVLARYRESTQRTLAWLADRPGRPAAMAAFDSLLSEDWREKELLSADRPIVGTTCSFVPEELIIAAGAVPLRIDYGQSALAEAGSQLMPTDTCSQIKSIVGARLCKLPWQRNLALLVLPTACDGKKKLPQLLSKDGPVHVLELPQTKDYRRAAPAWHEEVGRFAKRLQQLTKRRIRRRALAEAIGLVNRRATLVRDLSRLRWATPGVLSAGDFFLVMQSCFVADLAWWIHEASALLEELRQTKGAVSKSERAPLLLTGSPIFFPDYRLLHMIEEAGGEVVADEMCSGSEPLWHPTVLDEKTVKGMTRAVADRTLLPATCPCFVSADDRIRRLGELVQQCGARGVVHHTLRLCQLYDIERIGVFEALKSEALPMINIYSEHGEQESAMVLNRLEAFVEMLQQ